MVDEGMHPAADRRVAVQAGRVRPSIAAAAAVAALALPAPAGAAGERQDPAPALVSAVTHSDGGTLDLDRIG